MHPLLSPETSTMLTLALYAAAGLCGLAGMIARSRPVRSAAAAAAVVGFALQTFALATGFHASTAGGLSIGAYLQMLAWFLVLAGTALRIFMKHNAPLIFASVAALMLYGFSAPALEAVVKVPESLKAPFYALHIGALFLSLALIGLAFAAGAVFLYLDGRIKAKLGLPAFIADMPALNILDRINAIATAVGFPLYSIGMICGLFSAGAVYGRTVTGDPKEIISFATWVLYAVLFHNRLARGWYGRKPARLMVLIFILCAVSFVVVNLFMTSHHSFART